jgi:hypothetical protein
MMLVPGLKIDFSTKIKSGFEAHYLAGLTE